MYWTAEGGAVQLAFLGLISGTLSALVIILFRLSIELPQTWIIGSNVEDYESLPLFFQICLPLLGFLFIGIWLHFSNKVFKQDANQVGVAHVIERTDFHQGHFPLRNFVTQFITGAVAVISGQSSGREGAAVHLGATPSSFIGSRFKLNNQAMRVMIGCGTASAISASFNTPMAGVIFAMEVIIREYTIRTFIPIILASVVGAFLTQLFFGSNVAFSVPPFKLASIYEIPYLLLLAVAIGTASALSIRIIRFFGEQSIEWSVGKRMSCAALITCAGILVAPEIMGIGYDTVNESLLGHLSLKILLIISLCKIFVTSSVIGLGVPSGFIGPSIVMGATMGGALGLIGAQFSPDLHSNVGLYAMLGMGAMMGAVINAPLAALMAILELTANPNIILPAMLVIVISNLVCTELFKSKSVFQTLLEIQESGKRSNSLKEWLEKSKVKNVMEKRFQKLPKVINFEKAKSLVDSKALWIIVTEDQKPRALMPVAALAFHLSLLEQQEQTPETIDLLAIPSEKRDLGPITIKANLSEALIAFEEQKVEALFVVGSENIYNTSYVLGIIMRHHLENYYRS